MANKNAEAQEIVLQGTAQAEARAHVWGRASPVTVSQGSGSRKENQSANFYYSSRHSSQAFAAVKGNMTLNTDQLLKYVYLENLVGEMNTYEDRDVSVKVPADVQTAVDSIS